MENRKRKEVMYLIRHASLLNNDNKTLTLCDFSSWLCNKTKRLEKYSNIDWGSVDNETRSLLRNKKRLIFTLKRRVFATYPPKFRGKKLKFSSLWVRVTALILK